ncbi:MAG: cupin domain-containing protein [Erythrobacter sp.]
MTDRPGWLTRFAAFEAGLEASEAPFFMGLAHGSMMVELFKPEGKDTQEPHAQDELYIVQAGASDFLRHGDRVSVKAGDVIFVPAGMDHRFVDFSEDFATWVIFWGPEGGES